MATDTKPSQAEMIAGFIQMTEALTKAGISLTDLIAQHATLTTDKAALAGQVTTLTGDKAKLVAGATLPTDLVSAANTIAAKDAEIATLKGEKTTVEATVAKEVAKLGIVSRPAETAKKDDGKKLTITEQILKAKGCASLTELNEKHNAQVTASATSATA